MRAAAAVSHTGQDMQTGVGQRYHGQGSAIARVHIKPDSSGETKKLD